MAHPVGDTFDVVVTYKTAAGVLTNPTSITTVVRYPSGTTVNPTETSISTGKYAVPITVAEEGFGYYRITAVGNNVDSVVEGSFCGQASAI